MESRFSNIWGNRFWHWQKSDIHCWKHMHQKGNGPSVCLDVKTVTGKSRPELIIQAGGNCGMFPMEYLRWFNRVITFEPDPINFNCLIKNCNAPNELTAVMGVLGNNAGEMVPVRRSKKNIGATHVSKAPPTFHSLTFTIDSLNLKPDVIHLDIEGYELQALKGAAKTLKNHNPVLVCEIKSDMRFLVWEFIKRYGYKETAVLSNGDFVFEKRG